MTFYIYLRYSVSTEIRSTQSVCVQISQKCFIYLSSLYYFFSVLHSVFAISGVLLLSHWNWIGCETGLNPCKQFRCVSILRDFFLSLFSASLSELWNTLADLIMDAQAQQPQEQQQTSTKVFTVVETRHLLKILMNPKTLAMFKDNKQSHAFVWNYIFKCMKLKFPKFAKSTRQCYKKYVPYQLLHERIAMRHLSANRMN